MPRGIPLNLILILLLLILDAQGDIFNCTDQCKGCSDKCSSKWACVTVPAGNHDPSILDNLQLIEHGYKGLASINELAYRVSFQAATTSYPCEKSGSSSFCSNINKLFGFSRCVFSFFSRRQARNAYHPRCSEAWSLSWTKVVCLDGGKRL
jgi:hypothetical protein